MTRNAVRTDYVPNVEWKTLFSYERALRSFMRAGRPKLPLNAFSRLFAMSVRELPRARTFDPGDGGALGYRCYESEADVHLVLVHGAGCFGDQLHQIALAVARSGRAQAYTLDMRGHGLSDGERGHAVTRPGQIVEDVGAFLVRLRAERPDDRIILAGHSAGGGVVLGVSRTAADALVDGYVFLAPYVGLGSPSVRPYFGGWTSLHAARLRALVAANLFGITRFNGATVVEFDRDACTLDHRFVRSWSFNTMLAFGAGRWIERATPIAPGKPVLLLAGENDECFNQPLYREAFSVIAPHAAMPPVGACGHFDLLVDQTAIGEIAGWLDRNFKAGISSGHRKENDNVVAA